MTAYFAVYDAGQKWSEKAGRSVRNQVWEGPFKTKREAQAHLNQKLAEVQRGEWQPRKSISFYELAQVWLEGDARVRLKKQSLVRYEIALRKHIFPRMGETKMVDIKPSDLQKLVADCLDSGLSVSYVKSIAQLVREVVRRGSEWGYARNALAGVRLRYPQQARTGLNPPTPHEIRLIMDHAPERYRPIIVVAVWTGMRIGEVLAAKWKHVDWEENLYNVTETLVRRGEFDTPKTTHSASPVRLSPFVVEVLKDHRKAQAAERLLRGPDYEDHGLIFATKKGTPYRYQNMSERILPNILRDAGVRADVKWHAFRHACATIMIANGESPKVVQAQLRHQMIQQTMDTYGHLWDDAWSEVGDRFDGAMSSV